MVHWYILIAAGAIVDSSSRFYKIGIGNSMRDVKNLSKLQDFAAANGYYFHIIDNEASNFLMKIADSLGVQLFDLNIQRYKLQNIQRDLFKKNALPDLQLPTPQAIYFREQTDPAYYFLRQQNVISKAESAVRYKPKAFLDRN